MRDRPELALIPMSPPMEEPIVSVLMPVANGERFLPEALKSLQAQTLQAWELIAVLDGCTDRTEAILTEQRDQRIRVKTMPSRRGIAHALNRGLSACRSDFVARFDADDVCLPTRLERQVGVLRERPSLGVLGSAARLIDEDSQPVGFRAVQTGPRRLRLGLLFRNQFIHPSVMFRRSVVMQAGSYDERMGQVQDYELWLRVLRISQLDNVAEPLIAYRVYPGQSSSILRLESGVFPSLADSRRGAVESVGGPAFFARWLDTLWWSAQSRRRSGRFRRLLEAANNFTRQLFGG